MNIISRKEAKAQGLKTYFNNKACKYGHVCERRVDNCGCVQCSILNTTKWRILNPTYDVDYRKNNLEKEKARSKKYYNNHVEEKQLYRINWLKDNPEYNKEYYKTHSDQIKEDTKKWQEDNPDKRRLYSSEWRKKNPDKHAAKCAKHRSAKLQATPVWYESEKELIESMYEYSHDLSQSSDIIYHVDHVVPLQHPLVCGLHCIANLQVITESENCSKGNRFEIS